MFNANKNGRKTSSFSEKINVRFFFNANKNGSKKPDIYFFGNGSQKMEIYSLYGGENQKSDIFSGKNSEIFVSVIKKNGHLFFRPRYFWNLVEIILSSNIVYIFWWKIIENAPKITKLFLGGSAPQTSHNIPTKFLFADLVNVFDNQKIFLKKGGY